MIAFARVAFLATFIIWGYQAGAQTSESAASSAASSASSSTAVQAARPEATSDYRLSFDTKESRFSLGVYGEMSSFSFQGRSLMGSALNVSALYALESKYAAVITLAQAVSMQGGFGILFTGLRASVAYAWQGDFIRRASVLTVNGQTTMATKSEGINGLAFDVGLDQMMFNGTQRIVPATGLSLGVKYDRPMFGYNASFIARYGMLMIQDTMSSMMSAGGGILLTF